MLALAFGTVKPDCQSSGSCAQSSACDRSLIRAPAQARSLAYDLGLKARLYARHGAAEYWVIDVKRRRTIIHKGLEDDGTWASVETAAEDAAFTREAVPGFSLNLADA